MKDKLLKVDVKTYKQKLQHQRQKNRDPLEMIESTVRAKQESAKRVLTDQQVHQILEASQLRKEIKKLDQRIEKLMSNPIRPAHFLEPLYAPDQPLTPLIGPSRIERH